MKRQTTFRENYKENHKNTHKQGSSRTCVCGNISQSCSRYQRTVAQTHKDVSSLQQRVHAHLLFGKRKAGGSKEQQAAAEIRVTCSTCVRNGVSRKWIFRVFQIFHGIPFWSYLPFFVFCFCQIRHLSRRIKNQAICTSI